MPEEQAGRDDLAGAGRTEGFGERLLGSLLDRAHTMPPQLIAPLIAQEIARIGGRDVTVLLQDYDQVHTVFAELSKQARVTEHLPALVESEARDLLESRSASGGMSDRTS